MIKEGIPDYKRKYQPQPIEDILKWVDTYIEDWFYWNQSYVDYYRFMRNRSNLDFITLLDNLNKKGLFDGLVYVRLPEFPLILYGENWSITPEFSGERGYNISQEFDFQLVDTLFEPQIGDLFVYNGYLFMIIFYEHDLHWKQWKGKSTYIGQQDVYLNKGNTGIIIYEKWDWSSYKQVPSQRNYKVKQFQDQFLNQYSIPSNINYDEYHKPPQQKNTKKDGEKISSDLFLENW